jgi:hypothetical protein
MAKSIARTYVQGDIIKVGGTTRDKWIMDIFELFKRTATATITYANDYLLKGELLIPPEIDVPMIEIQWYNYFSEDFGTPFLEPAISHGAWLSDQESVGLVFANWYIENIEFDVEIPSYHLNGRFSLVETRNGDRVIIEPDITLPKTISLSMNQNDVILIETSETVNSTPPSKPTIDGPVSGKINTEYTYSSSTTDIDDGDYLFFLFDWGDDNNSGWIGPYNSGETCDTNYEWTDEGNYNIKVRVKDSNDVVSDWSDSLEVSMPKYKSNILYHFHHYLNFDFKICNFLSRIFDIEL